MAFNYEKNKSEGNDSFWTSYSDLFLGLSTIFLLLYVTTSLRIGTDSLKGDIENKKLAMQVEELKNQVKMYESIKEEYMAKQASKDETQEYQELMDKLTLLQEDAKTEKDRMIQDALENETKVKALNKYQQMVRNILNSNKVAKAKIVTRNEVIQEQDVEIDTQNKQIANLETDINSKKKLIEDGSKKIDQTQTALSKSLKDLKFAYKNNKITKKAFEQKTAKLKEQNQKEITKLSSLNQQYNQQLNQASQNLSQLSSQLAQTQGTLEQTKGTLEKTQGTLAETKGALAQKAGEAMALGQKLSQATSEASGLKGKITSLKDGYAADKARAKAEFDAELGRQKLGAAEKARKEAAFRAEVAGKEKNMQAKLGSLEGQLKDTEGALSKAKEEIDARRIVAQEIKKSFAKAGVKADVDMQTGEVVLDFGENYFESDSAKLNIAMKNVLEKAMPAYSKSLFENQKIAKKISAVEIIGFASPTYKGKFVDPNSSNPDDKMAMKYNMDLSYQRAKSIFNHVLDESNTNFKHQKDLLSLMKVSGRSFLEIIALPNRNLASGVDFCKVNDCKKAQRVIVRFSMDKK